MKAPKIEPRDEPKMPKTVSCYLLILATALPAFSIAAEPIRGSSAFEKQVRQIQPIETVQVQGPIYLTIRRGEHGNCSELSIFANKDILPHVTATSDEKTLRLSTSAEVIPSDWIYVTLECPNVSNITAGEFSVVGIEKLNPTVITTTSDGGAIEIAGDVQELRATVKNNGFLDTTLAKIKHAHLEVSSDSHAHAREITSYEAKVAGTGEIIFFTLNNKKYASKKIADGIYEKSSTVKSRTDSARAFKYTSFHAIKEKLK